MAPRMRAALLALLLGSPLAPGQSPEPGRFDYRLYDNGDRPVGKYFFTIERAGDAWRVASEMVVDTRFLFLPIRLMDRNSFVHDGRDFRSFHVDYLKDVPLQRTVRLEVSGVRDEDGWRIQRSEGGDSIRRHLSPNSFDEVRNLVSRLVRPQAVLRPGQSRKSTSLDPLSLEISEVVSRGIATDSVDFQGRRHELFVMEIRASDGDVTVKKFANGLIYLSRTPDGYALLTSARSPFFQPSATPRPDGARSP